MKRGIAAAVFAVAVLGAFALSSLAETSGVPCDGGTYEIVVSEIAGGSPTVEDALADYVAYDTDEGIAARERGDTAAIDAIVARASIVEVGDHLEAKLDNATIFVSKVPGGYAVSGSLACEEPES
jgi:hypothetical protein